MSNLLGPIRQLGYVVDDIEGGMKYWSEVMGVGPWFYNPRVPIEDYTFDGQRYDPENSVALANSGEMQVELIQIRNDAPSMYRDFMAKGLRGLQHVAFWTTQFDVDLATDLMYWYGPGGMWWDTEHDDSSAKRAIENSAEPGSYKPVEDPEFSN